MATSAALIVIGDEILSGKIRDTNGPYLIDKMRSVGVVLDRILTVRDDIDEIAWAVTTCRERYRPIFTSGGIGPTHDDLTVAGVARALGRSVVQHPDLVAALHTHYPKPLRPEAMRLANVPEGAELLRTPNSWYPLIAVDEIYLLPGIPQLFQMHLDGLAERYRDVPFHLRSVFLRLGETDIAAVLDRIAIDHAGVALGSYPRMDTTDHKVKLTLEARDPTRVEKALSDLLGSLPDGAVVRVE